MIESQLDINAESFTSNHEALFSEVGRIETTAELIQRGGSEKSRERHLSRGKLLPRERIEYLIDPGTAFLEVGLFAAYDHYDNEVPSAGVIAGVGKIVGTDCMIICNDATVKGGTYYPLTVKKHLRAQAIAEENHLPLSLIHI